MYSHKASMQTTPAAPLTVSPHENDPPHFRGPRVEWWSREATCQQADACRFSQSANLTAAESVSACALTIIRTHS